MIHEQKTRGGPRTLLLEGHEYIFFCDAFRKTSTLDRLFLEMAWAMLWKMDLN